MFEKTYIFNTLQPGGMKPRSGYRFLLFRGVGLHNESIKWKNAPEPPSTILL